MCRGGVCASTRCPRDRLCTEGAIQILCGHMHIPARRCACTHTYIHRTPTGGALHGRRHLGPWQARARTCTQKCARTHTHTRHPQKALHRRRPPGPQQARAHTCTHTNVHTHTTLTGGSAWKVPSGPLGGARAHTYTHTTPTGGSAWKAPSRSTAGTCSHLHTQTCTHTHTMPTGGSTRKAPSRPPAGTCSHLHTDSRAQRASRGRVQPSRVHTHLSSARCLSSASFSLRFCSSLCCSNS